jgi:hypothetical protein
VTDSEVDWRLMSRHLALDARSAGLHDAWWREVPIWLAMRELISLPLVVSWAVALYLGGAAYLPAIAISVYVTWLGLQLSRPALKSPWSVNPYDRFQSVNCPECGATPGEWCDPRSRPVYHKERGSRYRELVETIGLPSGVQFPLLDRGFGQVYDVDVPAWRRSFSRTLIPTIDGRPAGTDGN